MTTRGQAGDLEARLAKLPNVADSIGKPFSPDALQAIVGRLAGSGARAPASPALREALAQSTDAGLAEARAFAALGFALAGVLDAIGMGQVFELLAEQRQTGVLRVVNTATQARVELAFQDGRIDFATAVGVAEDLMLGDSSSRRARPARSVWPPSCKSVPGRVRRCRCLARIWSRVRSSRRRR